MEQVFKAISITDRVYWVGAIDWALRDFHGYATDRGTTYNAFLVMGDPVTLIDTVKKPFQAELLARIASVVDPRQVRYIVSNHSELDHTGCLPEVMDIIRPDKVFASAMGVKALQKHFRPDLPVEAVADGTRIPLGATALRFHETRMLHWPDSMIAYLEQEKLLFSQDAFGMHLATSQRFDDEIDPWILEYEAAKYYANILLPYSNLVQKLLEKAGQLGLDCRMIAPDHGPVWRANPKRIIELYARWAAQTPSRKAVVVFDTMWGSTDRMARAIADGLKAGGAEPVVMPLAGCDRSEVATEMLDAGVLAVGSPTLNSQMFPTVADVLTYLRGLKPKGRIGAAFGSYGWAPKAVPQINEMLKDMGVELVSEGVMAVYVPNEEDVAKCYALGLELARRLAEICPPA